VSSLEFETFYLAAKDRCYRALLATVPDAAEAEDLLAEAFCRGLGRWRRIAKHPAPEAWIVRTALNLHRDRWRRARTARRRGAPHRVVDGELGVDADVLRAVRELPDRQRMVVALRILLELSTEETAAQLGIAPGTVTAHLHRALSSLRVRLMVKEELW